MEQQNSIWNHCLQYAAKSDVGLRRANNQDSMAVAVAGGQQAWLQHGHLFMVADGMGAHAAGELASKIAVDTIPLTYHKSSVTSPPEALVRAITEANHQIHTRGQASADFRGMGTTCSVLALLPQGAMVAQVGDSRVYRRRGNRFEQLSFDHSLVWEMRQAGQEASDAFGGVISKNIITRSLGPNPTVKVDLEGPFPLEVGDTFLLCSDGLSGQVTDDEMGLVLSSLPPEEAVTTLIHLANLRGGPDNITVIVAQVTGPQVVQNAQSQASPLADKAGPPVSPLVWTWLGTSILAGLAMAAMGQWVIGAACGLSACAAAAFAMLGRGSAVSGSSWFNGRPYGKGPYVVCDCSANPALLERLANVFLELRQAVVTEKWTVDCSLVDSLYSRALAANTSQQYAPAACDLLRAISSLMEQLKQRRSKGKLTPDWL